MRFGLSDSTIEKISNVLAQYPQIESAILYGSRAKGNYKHGSGIDLTLVGDSNLTLPVLYRIMDEFDDLLLPYTIDLSIFANINDANVRAQIERVGVVFYARELAVAAEWGKPKPTNEFRSSVWFARKFSRFIRVRLPHHEIFHTFRTKVGSHN